MGKRWGLLASVSGALLVAVAPADARRIEVQTSSDGFGGSSCSLREAVESAQTNTNFGGCLREGKGKRDPVILRGGTTYSRSLGTLNEDANASGDIDITGKVEIKVEGAGKAVIDVDDQDRVFDVHPGASLTATKVEIVDGNVPGSPAGGGIASAGRTTLRKSVVASNSAGSAGGLSSSSTGNLILEDSTVVGNDSIHSGGGLFIGGPAVISRSTVTDNETAAEGEGGGIQIGATDEPITITNSTISGNRANSRGGGINVFDADLRLNAVTITDNAADFDGDGGGTLGGQGGGLNLVAGTASVKNSIIAANLATTSSNADCGGGLLPSGRIFTGQGKGCDSGNDIVTATGPMLLPLGDNGGPTQTHKLLKPSLAVGAASPRSSPRTDQRGEKRDRHPDMGAYER